LTAKWIVAEEWLTASSAAKTFLPETDFNGHRWVNERPFRGKTFYMTPSFIAQQAKQQFDPSCCRTLIENVSRHASYFLLTALAWKRDAAENDQQQDRRLRTCSGCRKHSIPCAHRQTHHKGVPRNDSRV
jgi:hypothetical protein